MSIFDARGANTYMSAYQCRSIANLYSSTICTWTHFGVSLSVPNVVSRLLRQFAACQCVGEYPTVCPSIMQMCLVEWLFLMNLSFVGACIYTFHMPECRQYTVLTRQLCCEEHFASSRTLIHSSFKHFCNTEITFLLAVQVDSPLNV